MFLNMIDIEETKSTGKEFLYCQLPIKELTDVEVKRALCTINKETFWEPMTDEEIMNAKIEETLDALGSDIRIGFKEED